MWFLMACYLIVSSHPLPTLLKPDLHVLTQSLWMALEVHISEMYFSHWKPPGVSERMWSVNLDASISGDYQTLGGHSGQPLE